jgi:hypothetical protein
VEAASSPAAWTASWKEIIFASSPTQCLGCSIMRATLAFKTPAPWKMLTPPPDGLGPRQPPARPRGLRRVQRCAQKLLRLCLLLQDREALFFNARFGCKWAPDFSGSGAAPQDMYNRIDIRFLIHMYVRAKCHTIYTYIDNKTGTLMYSELF